MRTYREWYTERARVAKAHRDTPKLMQFLEFFLANTVENANSTRKMAVKKRSATENVDDFDQFSLRKPRNRRVKNEKTPKTSATANGLESE